MTHGSWIVLYPTMLAFLRLQAWSQPFPVFWRRHTQMLRQIALTEISLDVAREGRGHDQAELAVRGGADRLERDCAALGGGQSRRVDREPLGLSDDAARGRRGERSGRDRDRDR